MRYRILQIENILRSFSSIFQMLTNVLQIMVDATITQHAITLLMVGAVHVQEGLPETARTVRTLMNVTDTMSIVMLMQTAQIFMDLIIVCAKKGTQEMAHTAVMLMNALTAH
jgi:hypothetical protein